MNNIALVTPVKNEIENLPRLIESIKNQTIRINLWVFIENDSTDGSAEYLNNLKKVDNVTDIHVLSLSFTNKEYDIGFKYSKVVQYGFDFVKKWDNFYLLDYIGLLDADSFPEREYFEKIVEHMQKDPTIGLSGGVLYLENGTKDSADHNQVRGSGRLWTRKCFEETGHYYGLSPDSITKRKAEIRGWKLKVIQDAHFYSREAGSRSNYEFFGRSAYYNGNTMSFAILKSVYYVFIKPKYSIHFIKGYFTSLYKRQERNPDTEIVNYNKKYLSKLLRRKLFKYFNHEKY